jgi:hypothetical protein
MPDIQAMTKQLKDQLERESQSCALEEPISVTDQRRKNVQCALGDDHPVRIEHPEIP